MGTRGLFGFRKDGIDKVNYVHWDSYPEGLGYGFITLLKHLIGTEKLDGWFDKIICVDENTAPTEEQINYCKEMGWVNLKVSSQSVEDWYCLTHELQEPEQWEQPCKADKEIFIKNANNFIYDSLYCENAYIYDLDKKQLEFYIGFQKVPDAENHYGTQPDNDGYYPCKLVCVITEEALLRVDIPFLIDYMKSSADDDEHKENR